MAGFQILPPEEDPAGRRLAAIKPLPAAPPAAAPIPVDPREAAIAEADAALNPAPPQAVRAMPAEPMPAPAREGAAPAPGPSPLDAPLDMVALPRKGGTPGLTAGEKAKVKSVGSTGEAVAAEAAINANAQAQAADTMALYEKKAAEEDARMAQEADERAKRYQSQLDDLDADIKLVREKKVDQNRVWANKSGFQQAATIMAQFFHGLSGKGGVAPAVEMLNQQIDRDVNAQKDYIEAQTRALAQRRQGINDRGELDIAREQAKLKAVAARRETLVMSLERIQAQAKSEAGKAKVQPLLDAMNAEQLQTQEKFAKLAQQRAAGGNKFVMIGPNGVPITLSREEAIKRASEIEKRDLEREKLGVERQEKGAKAAQDQDARYIPGYGYARTGEEGKTIRAEAASHGAVMKLTDQLIEWRKKNAGSLDPSKVAEGKAMARKLQLKAKDAAKLGVLSGSDLALLEDQIPTDPTRWGQVLPQLQAFKKSSQVEFDERIKAQGIVPEKGSFDSDFEVGVPDSGLKYKAGR